MFLLVDIGNSHIKVALAAGREIMQVWRMESRASRTTDEYVALLQSWLGSSEQYQQGVLERLIVASVVVSIQQQLVPALEQLTQHTAVHVSSDLLIDLGLLHFLVDNHPEVGADLLVSAVAALVFDDSAEHDSGHDSEHDSEHRLVIDMGSATTFNLLTRPHHFGGVSIAPGLEASEQALRQRAPALPPIALQVPDSPLGHNTVSAIQAGIVLGYVSMLEGMIARIADANTTRTLVIATGGSSSLLAPACNRIDHIAPNLTLDGLAIIAGALAKN
jgi:type III pantothenate kinase